MLTLKFVVSGKLDRNSHHEEVNASWMFFFCSVQLSQKIIFHYIFSRCTIELRSALYLRTSSDHWWKLPYTSLLFSFRLIVTTFNFIEIEEIMNRTIFAMQHRFSCMNFSVWLAIMLFFNLKLYYDFYRIACLNL